MVAAKHELRTFDDRNRFAQVIVPSRQEELDLRGVRAGLERATKLLQRVDSGQRRRWRKWGLDWRKRRAWGGWRT